ncbi:hypothetical protein M378DRAFT_7155 [Amanita muscaria Koide BX008]|uniref:PPM-type phosphatase domain-containing protein n=1 Tax=Amanita muscaria (strain Koide BX008) TaxID=946122 RepID=A0A0C2XMA0_AMAMK|nr:hypothetical protein M378DRAFT_7155 [Amanita muscaria Koide BX008]
MAIGTPAYLYYRYRYTQTFTIPVKEKGLDGKPATVNKHLSLMSLKDVDQRIRENETSVTQVRPNGLIWKHTTAFLASNDPIEDANSCQIIQRDDTDPSAPGDYLFFTVMDGHGGYHTSQLLSHVLINAVALELSQLIQKPQEAKLGRLEWVKSAIRSPNPQSSPGIPSQQRVSLAIQDAFTKLDSELLNAPLRILANNIDEESSKNKVVPDLSQHPLALPSMLSAISGSCAIMAVFDTANRDLHVACTGDSRAVAGVWESTEDGKGQWRVEVLSEDQTGRNMDEKKRMQSEHPADEADYVIRDGRVLGGLEPTRAFGDARYKWPRPVQESLNQAFMVGNNKPMRPPPQLFKTPPYVTATPVVSHRELSLPDENESTPKYGAIRFVVLATDGLWDQLTNEEVVALVGGHFAGLKGAVPRSQLPDLVPVTSGSQGVEGKKKKDMKTQGHWAFKDDNLSAHLIRNAFGGGDELHLRKMLSIPAPYSRRYRDDVTVTVVWWEHGKGDTPTVATITGPAKAKL